MVRTLARWALAIVLGAMGVAHIVSTRGFRLVVPDWAARATGLDKDAIVIASGTAEVTLAAGLVAVPRDRKRIGWASAVFFIVVFPGNVYQWRTARSSPGLDTDTKRFGRLLLQPLLVAWALWSTRESERPDAR